MRPSMNIFGQLRNMNPTPAKSKLANIALAPPTVAFMGIAAIKGLGRVARDGTVITNSWFYRNAHSGYGKRGIDSNNHGADGLVSALHNKRRVK